MRKWPVLPVPTRKATRCAPGSLNGPSGRRGVGVQVGEQHDRELEALGGVDRHEPHDVVGLLGDARLGLAHLLVLLLVEPAREGAQPAAARDGERARLVGDLQHVRGDLRAARPSPSPPRASASSTNPAASIARRTSSVSDRPRRCRCRSRSTPSASTTGSGSSSRSVAVVDAPARGDAVGEQVVVGAAERARAQRRDDAQRVGRVVDRAQERDQLGHLGVPKNAPARLGAVRDAARRQRVDVELDPGAGRQQDHAVAPGAGRCCPVSGSRRSRARRGPPGRGRRRGARPPARGSRRPWSACPSPWTTTTGARCPAGAARTASSGTCGGCMPRSPAPNASAKTRFTQSSTPVDRAEVLLDQRLARRRSGPT